MNPDFRDMLSALSEAGAEYLVVGAYALAAHGYPRATGDMDVWVKHSRENAQKVWSALVVFGAPLEGLTREDLNTPGTVFQIGVAPRRIDILTSITGVDFDDAWPRHRDVEFEGATIPVLGREDLLKNKKALKRPKDLADVAWLEGEQA